MNLPVTAANVAGAEVIAAIPQILSGSIDREALEHPIGPSFMRLPNIRLYDLRHTSATLALTVGVAPKVVSEQLGHSSAAFTLDTYSHVLPHMQEEAAAKMEAALVNELSL